MKSFLFFSQTLFFLCLSCFCSAQTPNARDQESKVTNQSGGLEFGLHSNLFTSNLGGFDIYLVNPMGNVLYHFSYDSTDQAGKYFSLPKEAPIVEGNYTLFGYYTGSPVSDSVGEFYFDPGDQTFSTTPPGGTWTTGDTFSTMFTYP